MQRELEIMEATSISNHTDLENKRSMVVAALRKTFVEFKQVQDDVIDNHLQKWKDEQREKGDGDENSLMIIQTFCEDLVEMILLLKQKIEQINWESMDQQEFQWQILTFLQYMVSSTFLVVKQPLQV